MAIDDDRQVAADLLEEHGFEDLAKEIRSPKVVLNIGKLVTFKIDDMIVDGCIQEIQLQQSNPLISELSTWDRITVPRTLEFPSAHIQIQFVSDFVSSEKD